MQKIGWKKIIILLIVINLIIIIAMSRKFERVKNVTGIVSDIKEGTEENTYYMKTNIENRYPSYVFSIERNMDIIDSEENTIKAYEINLGDQVYVTGLGEKKRRGMVDEVNLTESISDVKRLRIIKRNAAIIETENSNTVYK